MSLLKAKLSMFKLEYSTQFKKDFKKITNMPISDIIEVGNVISKLQRGEQLQLARLGSHSDLF